MKSSYLSLYFDEDVSVKIAVNLRNRGFDIQTTVDADNLGASDERQLKYAAGERRVFVTHNLKDFIVLHKNFLSTGKAHAGIVLLVRRKDSNSIVMRLLQFIQNETARSMQDQLRYL